MPASRLFPAGLLFALLPVAALAASPDKIREVRLDSNLQEPAGWLPDARNPVFELALSPDGRYVAATMGLHLERGGASGLIRRTHLFIVDVRDPKAPVRQIDLEGCEHSLEWSPDGRTILLCDVVVHLEDGSSCDLAQTPNQQTRRLFATAGSSHWIGSQRLIRLDRTIANQFCRTTGRSEVESGWTIAGSIPEHGWLLLQQLYTIQAENGRTVRLSNYSMADLKSGKLTSALLLPAGYSATTVTLAEGAAAFCSQLQRLGDFKWELRCWTFPGGEVIPIAPRLKGYNVVQGSLYTPRVIAERWVAPFFSESPGELRNVIVLDIHFGREIASMKASRQHDVITGRGRDSWFSYALSPDGTVLAEGGNGAITFYRVP